MKSLFILLLALVSLQGCSANWHESSDVSELFREADVTGTFVLYDIRDNRFSGHNQERASKRFVPASTFKIPNSLIGLSVGAVESVDDILPYGNKPQLFKAWEKDMGLRDAITLSNIPIYQELARRIGLEKMQENVLLFDYGNRDIGSAVDMFWLEGPLEISAFEQTLFLAKLAQNKLPISKSIQASVQEIVLLEEGVGWQLYGKTGWQNAPDPGVGWWVGWVRKADRVYSFALNIDIRDGEDASTRVKLGRASLEVLGVL